MPTLYLIIPLSQMSAAVSRALTVESVRQRRSAPTSVDVPTDFTASGARLIETHASRCRVLTMVGLHDIYVHSKRFWGIIKNTYYIHSGFELLKS